MFTSRSNGALPLTSRPADGSSNPAIIRRVVVLPEPDGPSMAKNSPSPISRSTPATASTSPNRLWTPSRRTAATAGPAGPGWGPGSRVAWSVGLAKDLLG